MEIVLLVNVCSVYLKAWSWDRSLSLYLDFVFNSLKIELLMSLKQKPRFYLLVMDLFFMHVFRSQSNSTTP